MKKEIKVGDCFKDSEFPDDCLIIVGEREEGWIVLSTSGNQIQKSDTDDWDLNNLCTPITRAEFDAELQNAFDRIKAELPEVQNEQN